MDLLELYILGEGYVHYEIIDILENLDGITVWNGLGNGGSKEPKKGCRNDGSLWDSSGVGIRRRDILLNFHLGLSTIYEPKN